MKKFYAVSVIALSLALGFTSCSDDDDSSDDVECMTCTAEVEEGFIDFEGFDDLLGQLEDIPGIDLDDLEEDEPMEIEVCNVDGMAEVNGQLLEVTFADYIESFVGTCE